MSSNASSSTIHDSTGIYFTCLWRKPQARKHKTWEGDGILAIHGSSCVIKSRENGDQLAAAHWSSEQECQVGKTYMIGGKEVEIDQPISYQEMRNELQPQNQPPAQLPKLIPLNSALPQSMKGPPKINLKFKSPMQSTCASQSRATSDPHKSRFFVQSTLNRPFSVPGHPASNGLKRMREVQMHDDKDTSTERQMLENSQLFKSPSPRLPLPLTEKAVENENSEDNQIYVCLHRKIQGSSSKKNSTWDGDCILSFLKTQRGKMAVVKDLGDGKVLGSMLLEINSIIRLGAVMRVGSREVEIQRRATESEVVNLENLECASHQPLELGKAEAPSRSSHAAGDVDDMQRLGEGTGQDNGNPPHERQMSNDGERRKIHLLSRPRVNQVAKSTIGGSDEHQAYVCMYRKIQGSAAKKHSTWDGDGILSLLKSPRGKMAVIKDMSTGRVLGSMLLGLNFDVRPGLLAKVGSREVEIQRPATECEVEALDRAIDQPLEASWTDVVGRADVGASFKNPLTREHHPTRLQANLPTFNPQSEGAVVLTKPDEAWLLKNNPKNAAVVDVVVDPLIARSLRSHQIDGLKFMYECTMGMREVGGNGCILADEMGLGKSVQAISLLWTLLRQNPLVGQGPIIKRAMIVCPVTLVQNWKREINKWLGRSRLSVFVADGKTNIKQFTGSLCYNVLIIGYEKLRTLSKELNSIYPPIGLIIADEGHRLKSIEAKTTQALRTLKTHRRVVLSGTPIQNNLTEYFAMVDFVNPGILNDYRTFKKTFEQPILKSREPCCTPTQKSQGEARAEELAKLSRNYVLRRGSEVIAQHLPTRHDYCVFVSPTKVQRRVYEAILDSPEIRAVFSGDTSQHLVLINTLKKLCNSPGLLMNEGSIKSLEQNASKLFPAWVTPDDIQLSGKLMVLSRYLKVLRNKDEEKIILVSNFTKTLDIIEAHCRASSYSFCRLDGKTPQNQRDNIVQAFNRASPRAQFIFLLSSKSGGVGLNLIGASRLILFDGDWNPANDLQAMARIWRQGQEKACHIYRFLTTGTIDECILQRQVTKIGLATDLMNVPKAGEESGGGGNIFTKDELRRLFELHTNTSCHTHDLMGCQCLKDEPEKPPEWEDEDESAMEIEKVPGSDDTLPELDLSGFLPASKYRPSMKRDALKLQRKLAELETWSHVDPSDSKSLLELEDEILNQTIIQLASKPINKNHDDDDDDDGSSSNDEENTSNKDGGITFVFKKKNG